MGKWELDEVFDFTLEFASGEAKVAEHIAEMIARDTVKRYCQDAKLYKDPSYSGIDVLYEEPNKLGIRLILYMTRILDGEEVIFHAFQYWARLKDVWELLGEIIVPDLERLNGIGFDYDCSFVIEPFIHNDVIREVYGVVKR